MDTYIQIRCPECGKFLFEAALDCEINVRVKCRCRNYVIVQDAERPVIESQATA